MIVGAVVLAAGKSVRMGKNKLLLSLNGKKLIDNVLDALTTAGIERQIVVLGYKPEEIVEALKPRLNRVETVLNRDFELGMTCSFQTGLRSLLDADAAFLVLGDEPILDPNLLRSMIEYIKNGNGDVWIVSPIHEGKKGHPLLFGRQLFGEIFALDSKQTIRDVVHAHRRELLTVEAPEWTIMDIDTPQDYERAKMLTSASC